MREFLMKGGGALGVVGFLLAAIVEKMASRETANYALRRLSYDLSVLPLVGLVLVLVASCMKGSRRP